VVECWGVESANFLSVRVKKKSRVSCVARAGFKKSTVWGNDPTSTGCPSFGHSGQQGGASEATGLNRNIAKNQTIKCSTLKIQKTARGKKKKGSAEQNGTTKKSSAKGTAVCGGEKTAGKKNTLEGGVPNRVAPRVGSHLGVGGKEVPTRAAGQRQRQDGKRPRQELGVVFFVFRSDFRGGDGGRKLE